MALPREVAGEPLEKQPVVLFRRSSDCRWREESLNKSATAEHAAKIARAFGHAITEQQILYPGDYMTAAEIEAMQPEPEAA